MTLRETLDRAFTTKVREAWQAALEFVAGAMRRGAAPTLALKAEVSSAPRPATSEATTLTGRG